MDEIEGPASERGAVPCGVLPAVVVPRGPAPLIGVVLEGWGPTGPKGGGSLAATQLSPIQICATGGRRLEPGDTLALWMIKSLCNKMYFLWGEG